MVWNFYYLWKGQTSTHYRVWHFLCHFHKHTAERLPPSSVPDRVFRGSPDITQVLKGLGFFGHSMRGNSSPSCCLAVDSLHWAFASSKSHWKNVDMLIYYHRWLQQKDYGNSTIFKYGVIWLLFPTVPLDIILISHKVIKRGIFWFLLNQQMSHTAAAVCSH